jgi:hypothetical protein
MYPAVSSFRNFCHPLAMPRKRKLKKFSAVKAVKSLARERVGTPPPVKREDAGRPKQKPKYKKKLTDLLSADE